MHASALFHSLALVTFLSLLEVSLINYLKLVPERDENAHSFSIDILEIRRLFQHLHAIHPQFFGLFSCILGLLILRLTQSSEGGPQNRQNLAQNRSNLTK
jgi:hypothetical protein